MSGLAGLVIGLAALAAPTTTVNSIGYTFVTPGGCREFMTFYGGFYAGIGQFLLLATPGGLFRHNKALGTNDSYRRLQ
ncbi:hypothetical protein [Salinigranum rubrum]|uniref:hypothetical protein n=1 Tax=Salinigranum rubrum TaxID=755307 RepID=UPI0013A5BA13|nr:hypothetical protein [Salinigranum rubrum]